MEGMEPIQQLVAAIAGIVTSFLMTGLRKVSTLVDRELPPFARSLIVTVLAFGVAQLGAWLGLELTANPLAWDAEQVNAIVVTLLGMGAHSIVKTLRQ